MWWTSRVSLKLAIFIILFLVISTLRVVRFRWMYWGRVGVESYEDIWLGVGYILFYSNSGVRGYLFIL